MHVRPSLLGERRPNPTDTFPTIPVAVVDWLLKRRTSPPVYSEALPHLRLLRRLAQALNHRLTIISAPAGSGKTTLLSQWAALLAASFTPPRVAWLTLAPEANDPAMLARGLEVALQRAGALAPASDRPAATTEAVGVLLAPIAPRLIATETVLILDGAEQLGVESEAILAILVEEAPAQCHIVLATRGEPALPLPRLRVQRAVLELRGSDLAWDEAEAAALLAGPLGLRHASNQLDSLLDSPTAPTARHSAVWGLSGCGCCGRTVKLECPILKHA